MEDQFRFQKMTPFDNVEMGIYGKAMEYIFASDDIRNIAISGAYGAGKSSMVESYKKAHPEKKFIHISFAHFVPVKGEDGEEDGDGSKQAAALEGKIINQLIHQIEPQNIPQTNFRIKKKVDDRHILKTALLVTAFIVFTCFLQFKDAWANMVNSFSIPLLRRFLYFTTTNEMEFLAGAAALVILCRAVYEIVRLQKSVKLFKKFNIQGNEIEVFGDSKDSYFDKYLNEVLYIFEHTDADGIVFEDMDRYDTNVVFEKLREINFLLNQRKRMNAGEGQRRVMRFFYLLRDDIFVSKDRTKFFDFILPVVPVVDASNAYDKFIEYFKEANLLELFDMDFIRSLSIYVDDMRILKNICNEFIIYHEKLNTSFTEQGNNKLLAMIVYKNIFPNDFGCLQAGRGYVHTLFADKKKFASDRAKQLEEKADALQKENERIKSERIDDMDELNAIYFLTDGYISVDGKGEREFKSRKEFVKAILKSENIKRYTYNTWQSVNISEERKAMEQNPAYMKQKELIKRKSNHGIAKNNVKISQLKSQMEELEYCCLKDIITRENEAAVFQTNYINLINEEERFEEVKRSPYFDLIKFLIREGYLDETYPDYMTYFYENSITANDKIFLRSITDRHPKPFDYRLDNAALVISRMRKIDFRAQEALNRNLLEQLLSDKEKYEGQLQDFLDMIRNTEPVGFVSDFLDGSAAREKFVEELNLYWTGANRWIISTDGFTLQQKRCYVKDTLRVSSDEVIRKNNQEDEIREFIENDTDFQILSDADADVFINKYEMLGILFKKIDFEAANVGLLWDIYNNSMYELTIDIVKNMLVYYYGIPEADTLLCKNLSFIFSRPDQPLYGYVKDNIDLYIEELLAATQETEDTEEIVLYVLNSGDENITEEHKKAYIASSKTVISHLGGVGASEWWDVLLEQDNVRRTPENLCEYYFKSGNGMDDRLIQFINGFEQPQLRAVTDTIDAYEEKQKEALFLDVTKCNGIKNEIYEEILCALGKKYIKLSETKIEPEKMAILIRQNALAMNGDILKFMREHYAAMCMPFIMHNIRQYADIMNKNIFSASELMQILEEDIDDGLKIRLLQFATEPVSIQNRNYSEKVEDYIVENLYCDKDLGYLVKRYPANREELRKQIIVIATEAIRHGVEIPCAVHAKLLEELLLSGEIDDVDKQVFLAQQIRQGIQKPAARTAFEQLELPGYKQLLEGKQEKVEATSTGEALLEALRERKWISEYSKDPEDPEMFQAYGRVARKKQKIVFNPDKIAIDTHRRTIRQKETGFSRERRPVRMTLRESEKRV